MTHNTVASYQVIAMLFFGRIEKKCPQLTNQIFMQNCDAASKIKKGFSHRIMSAGFFPIFSPAKTLL